MKKISGQFKTGRTPWNKGKKGLQVSARKGVKLSKETKRKISISKKGQRTGFLGKKHTEKTKQKIREIKRKNTPKGSKSHMWKGGVSKIDRSIRRLREYFIWRSSVFERDKWTCQTCGDRGYVTAHHIKSFASILREYKIKTRVQALKCQELWDIENGVTLCEPCHSLTDNYKGRKKRV